MFSLMSNQYSSDDEQAALDFVIVGAGPVGLYALLHLRQRGFRCRVIDAAGDVGGVWYWNRYPGCRVDVESFEYGYTFDAELDRAWRWKERYAGRDELLDYFRFFADRFDLHRDITLKTRVDSAIFNESRAGWTVRTSGGEQIETRFVIMATGFVSAPNEPSFPGLADYTGQALHSAQWPAEPVDFAGKRVAIIGTGSTGVQLTPVIAETAAEVVVFQRTPPYSVPLRNEILSDEAIDAVLNLRDEWRDLQRSSPAGMVALHGKPVLPVKGLWAEATEEERRTTFQTRWDNGGLLLTLGNFGDITVDRAANDYAREYWIEQTLTRIDDPALASKVIPRYPIGTKRLTCDTGYYEALQRDNVQLVDVRADPIETFTEKGLRVGGVEHEFDIVCMATGFDAVVGAMLRMDIRGRDGRRIQDHWSEGPQTALGMMTTEFPNLFFVDGPQSTAGFVVPALVAELCSEWIGDLVARMDADGERVVEPSSELQSAYTNEVVTMADGTLMYETDSWYLGANIPGRPKRPLIFMGGYPAYRTWLEAARGNGWSEFVLGKGPGPSRESIGTPATTGRASTPV
jgi:cation diffusion facilitator CzcD-associated flavoprotein CzcO